MKPALLIQVALAAAVAIAPTAAAQIRNGASDVQQLVRINTQGRLRLADGDNV
jgi:hypothetical protein